MFDFDPNKDVANQAKHGISLARAAELKVEATTLDPYVHEVRYRSFGLIDNRAYCLVFTVRQGVRRAISLRRVRYKEYSRYVASK